jgi:hypothetical protein
MPARAARTERVAQAPVGAEAGALPRRAARERPGREPQELGVSALLALGVLVPVVLVPVVLALVVLALAVRAPVLRVQQVHPVEPAAGGLTRVRPGQPARPGRLRTFSSATISRADWGAGVTSSRWARMGRRSCR